MRCRWMCEKSLLAGFVNCRHSIRTSRDILHCTDTDTVQIRIAHGGYNLRDECALYKCCERLRKIKAHYKADNLLNDWQWQLYVTPFFMATDGILAELIVFQMAAAARSGAASWSTSHGQVPRSAPASCARCNPHYLGCQPRRSCEFCQR